MYCRDFFKGILLLCCIGSRAFGGRAAPFKIDRTTRLALMYAMRCRAKWKRANPSITGEEAASLANLIKLNIVTYGEKSFGEK